MIQDHNIDVTQAIEVPKKFSGDLTQSLASEESTREMCDMMANYLIVRNEEGEKELLLDLESPPLSEEIARQKQS